MALDFLAPFSPAFGLAVADFLGATLGPPATLASFLAVATVPFLLPFFAGLSDSEAEEAELLVALAVGKALVLGLRDGTFLVFFFDFSSELLEAEEAELLELFFESEESSESLELSPLPEDDEDEELDEELPDEELPEVAEEEALLEPALGLGGILPAPLRSPCNGSVSFFKNFDYSCFTFVFILTLLLDQGLAFFPNPQYRGIYDLPRDSHGSTIL